VIIESSYEPDKAVWTQADYEHMCWHDVSVHGFAIQVQEGTWHHNLLLDIDYILKWVSPTPPNMNFSFWVAPCTLVFKNVFDLEIATEHVGGRLQVPEIESLGLVGSFEQEKGVSVYEWHLSFHNFGDIWLKSYGFTQILRAAPVLTGSQALSIEERDGISFDNTPYK